MRFSPMARKLVTDKERRTMVQMAKAGAKYAEICRTTGRPHGTVCTVLHQARADGVTFERPAFGRDGERKP